LERIIDSELRGLETMIAHMCELAHEALSVAPHESLYHGDSYDKIRETSDFLMILADQVKDKAVEIILKFQPVASDLRMVKTFTRISYNLARPGRYALDIAYVNKAYVNKRFNGIRGLRRMDSRVCQRLGPKGHEHGGVEPRLYKG